MLIDGASVGLGTLLELIDTPAMLPPPKPKPRSKPSILCLHGKHGNNETSGFQTMILGLNEYNSKYSCVFLEGPYNAAKFDEGLAKDAKAWHVGKDPVATGLKTVVEHIESKGPYDGAYAFSQGACVVTLLSDPLVWKAMGGSDARFPPWKWVIIGCGSDYLLDGSRYELPERPPTAEAPLTLPSFHIIGRKDGIIDDSLSLSRRYKNSVVVYHEEGHAIPIGLAAEDCDQRKQLKAFLRERGL